VLRNTKIADQATFETIFPDAGYYPGTLAKAMAYNQLNTAVVYFPFLKKQNEKFIIPPLHKDLAIAMNSPNFRYSTTFDNRQWMDIRGVGSGAADIGYVERGAYMERNVILHEFVHQFHDAVLTDEQNRRIRALYYNAMANNLTLDYYSENNEHEYLAQTYPAYFEPMKVHPLDFKSMNTTSALKTKDPEMYAFLDALIANERRYLAGDHKAMASNWAQVYVNMSRRERRDRSKAIQYLDSALIYDSRYQPALLAKASLQLLDNDTVGALASIKASEAIDPSYAPTYRSYADYVRKTEKDPQKALSKQVEWLQKALSLEKDLQTKAGMAGSLRQLWMDYSHIPEAIEAADDYVLTGAEVSTYLRDRKDDARMFAAYRRAMMHFEDQLPIMDSLVQKKPQNYNYSLNYADALTANDEFDKSIALMQKVQRIFASNRSRRPDFDLRIAEAYFAKNQTDSARLYYDFVKTNKSRLNPDDTQRLYRLSLELNTGDEIPDVKPTYPENGMMYIASCHLTKAMALEKAGRKAEAYNEYNAAWEANPRLVPAKDGIRRTIDPKVLEEKIAKVKFK